MCIVNKKFFNQSTFDAKRFSAQFRDPCINFDLINFAEFDEIHENFGCNELP